MDLSDRPSSNTELDQPLSFGTKMAFGAGDLGQRLPLISPFSISFFSLRILRGLVRISRDYPPDQ